LNSGGVVALSCQSLFVSVSLQTFLYVAVLQNDEIQNVRDNFATL